MKDLEILKAAADYLKDQPKVVFDPYPDYDERVMNALGTLKSDTDYLEHHANLEDKPIETLNLTELATIYTFIQRGERFCDGYIAGVIEDGSLLQLVNRHIELLEEQKPAGRRLFSGRKKKDFSGRNT